MEGTLEALVGVLICTLPPGLVIALIVWAARAGRGGAAGERVRQMEEELARARSEHAALLQRVSRLEAAVVELSHWAKEAHVRIVAAGSTDLPAAPAVEPASAPGAASLTSSAPSAADGGAPAASSVAPSVAPVASSGTPSGALVARTDATAETGGAEMAGAVGAVDSAPAEDAAAGAPIVTAGVGEAAGAPSLTTAAGAANGAPSDATAAGGATNGDASQAPPGDPAADAVAPATAAPSGAGAPGAAGAAAPAAVPPPRPPASASGGWERWIGVRGAAALGASILVLAGIYFFEYSIEHGLFTPAMRMVAGTIVGLTLVLTSELMLRRAHRVLANWLAGAGVAILYVAFWAGRALYDLYPTWAAGLLMVAVTVTGVTLAVRRESQAIAVLGLLGGFITPLALSTGTDRPIALFGYVLLLDGAMLWVAYKRRWSWMALLCLVATALYQNAWLLARLDQPRVVLGVVIVAVFAILFAALPRSRERDAEGAESPTWKLARSAGVLLPLLFTVPLAVRTDLGDTFWPTAVQLVLLCAAACWVGRRHASALLPSGAALLAVGSVLGWALSRRADTALEVWQVCGLSLAIAALFCVNAELDRSEGRPAAMPALLAVLSMLNIAALGAPFARAGGLWPWLVLFASLSALGVRQAGFDRAPIQIVVAALSALGLGATFAAGAGRPELPSAALFLGVLVASAAAMQLPGIVWRAPELRRYGDHAAAVFALGLLVPIGMVGDERAVPVWAFYGATILLAVLALFAAARSAAPPWLPVALAASALTHGLWVARRASGPFSLLELAFLGTAVLLHSGWPIVAPRSTRDSAWSWRTAALAGPLYLLALRHVHLDALGPRTIGLLPIVLAAIALAAAAAVRVRGPAAHGARSTALVWLLAASAGFVTLAIPLQLDREWITIGWALEALALVVLWRRFDHAGLKYLALALAAVVCVRLVFNPYVLGYYERSELRILNWLSYTYLVPAAALIGVWALLRGREIERRRPWERSLFPARHALLANLAASAAVMVLFVWLNLTIVDWFATGPELTIPTERMPARDLTISIAWALFALALLALGLLRKSTALRVTSLGLVLVTCGKAFLYDLAHLEGLYRVASLVGLALSLIVISLAYQRFVFRVAPAPEQAK